MSSATSYIIRERYTYFLVENGHPTPLQKVVDECRLLSPSSDRYQFVMDLLRNFKNEADVRTRCDGPTPSMALFNLQVYARSQELDPLQIAILRCMR